MCASCGIAVTVGPCLYQCIGPYLKTCLASVWECVIWIMKKIVLPIIEFLHSWGIFEAFFYLFCFQWIYEGSLLHVKQDTGFWVAFAGITFAMPMFFYSTYIHTKNLRSSGKSKEIVINLYMLWLVLFWIPVCVRHQSTLVGYMCFIVIFTFLGFRMVFFGLGIGLGWEDD